MQHQRCSTWTTSRTVAHNLAEQEDTTAILWIWLLSHSQIEDENFTPCIEWPVNNNLHSSSFQHNMHDHTHQYNMGEQRISTVPTSNKSIPHSSLLNDHSSCSTGKYGKAMEAVHQIDNLNMSTINLSPMEAFSSDSAIISSWSRTQHLFRQPLNFSRKNLHSMEFQSWANIWEEGFYLS